MGVDALAVRHYEADLEVLELIRFVAVVVDHDQHGDDAVLEGLGLAEGLLDLGLIHKRA